MLKKQPTLRALKDVEQDLAQELKEVFPPQRQHAGGGEGASASPSSDGKDEQQQGMRPPPPPPPTVPALHEWLRAMPRDPYQHKPEDVLVAGTNKRMQFFLKSAVANMACLLRLLLD
eukprot:GEZU01002169.1.p1 GENE.GEZU01002169.1~~GEZU01002169.1.p1  ORF type:complete len:117 (-),score=37.76 GEZU01002169.1:58-408(-)